MEEESHGRRKKGEERRRGVDEALRESGFWGFVFFLFLLKNWLKIILNFKF